MVFLSFAPILLLQLTFFNGLHGAKWAYFGPGGEHQWSKDYPYCGGAFQSPIDIKSELLRFDPTLGPIAVQNYNLVSKGSLTLGNNGHSLQISLPPEMHISGLAHRYSAAQLHLHWGSNVNTGGSEHLVNSKQYAAELHIVHYNTDKYPDLSTAVDKSDGLAVLGVLIEIGAFNPAFDNFLRFVKDISHSGQKVQVPGFNVRDLLPARLDEYYRYDGSLTTPPCYPSVLWTVFRNHLTISLEQYQSLVLTLHFTTTQEVVSVPMINNFRKPLPADKRVVLVSFKEADLSWMNMGFLVPLLVGSALGLVLIISLMCCLLRQIGSDAEQDKSKGVGYNVGEQDEYGSTV